MNSLVDRILITPVLSHRFKIRILRILAVAVLGAALCSGCKGETKPALVQSDNKIIVAVSIVPQASFVQAVAGDLVSAIVLIPPGSSESNYAPAPQNLVQLSKAALYFAIGVPTEQANILPKLPGINAELKIIDLAEEAAQAYPRREYEPGQPDPHIWLSPQRVKIMVESIARNLAEADPLNEESYRNNAAAFLLELAEIDRRIKLNFSQTEKKTFLVYHPAFGYFADEYGLNMLAVENEGKEANIDDLRAVIDKAKKERITTIFYQAEADSKQADAVAQELSGEKVLLAPLAANYLENLETMAGLIAASLMKD